MATSACQDLAQRLRIVVAYEPADMASAACDILSEAIRLHGVFAGSEYAKLRAAILHPPSECPIDMQLGQPCHAYAANRPKVIAWDRVAGLLAAGELAELRTKDDVWRLRSWETACHTAADAIERAIPPPDPAAEREGILRTLEPADRKAYYTYAYAETKLGATTDRQAYQWLKDNGLPDERESLELAKLLAGYTLPTFATWTRKLRNARRVLEEQKHTSRAGRAAGSGSIVGSRELDKSEDAD